MAALPKLTLALWRAGSWLQWRTRARAAHGLHSPFVYQLATQVLPDQPLALSSLLEAQRQQALQDPSPLQYADLGAGMGLDGKAQRSTTVAQTARSSACPPRKGRLLHRLAALQQPQHALELGTHLGYGSAYLASALPPGSQLLTWEGAPPLVQRAQQLWARLPQPLPIVPSTGAFEALFAQQTLPPLGLVYLDGHHTQAATLRYYDLLQPCLQPQALLILDDIRWSPGMYRAWQALAALPEVTLSADCGQLGLLWLRRPQAKQHFWLRPTKKPRQGRGFIRLEADPQA